MPLPIFTSISLWQPQCNLFLSLFFKMPHISKIIQYLSFFVWLTSLSMKSSWSIHVVKMARFPSFLWLNNIPVCVCVCVCTHVYHSIYSIHSFIDGHLGCCYDLAVVNNATVNTVIQISLWDSDFVSFRYVSWMGIAGSSGGSIFSFFEEPL